MALDRSDVRCVYRPVRVIGIGGHRMFGHVFIAVEDDGAYHFERVLQARRLRLPGQFLIVDHVLVRPYSRRVVAPMHGRISDLLPIVRAVDHVRPRNDL